MFFGKLLRLGEFEGKSVEILLVFDELQSVQKHQFQKGDYLRLVVFADEIVRSLDQQLKCQFEDFLIGEIEHQELLHFLRIDHRSDLRNGVVSKHWAGRRRNGFFRLEESVLEFLDWVGGTLEVDFLPELQEVLDLLVQLVIQLLHFLRLLEQLLLVPLQEVENGFSIHADIAQNELCEEGLGDSENERDFELLGDLLGLGELVVVFGGFGGEVLEVVEDLVVHLLVPGELEDAVDGPLARLLHILLHLPHVGTLFLHEGLELLQIGKRLEEEEKVLKLDDPPDQLAHLFGLGKMVHIVLREELFVLSRLGNLKIL